MASLTVIVPTYNEEAYLKDALHSVQFADEIIVIDSKSEDNTIAIAEKFGAKILIREFDNFSEQKNFALAKATGDWILFLDADERVPLALQKEIEEAIAQDTYGGFKIYFPHFYLNRFLYHHKDNVLRLVQRKGANYSGSVHEKLVCKEPIGQLKTPMLHYSYKSLRHYINKKEAYAWFQAQQLYDQGKRTHFHHLLFKPFYRFFRSYILKGGIFDGVPGLVVSAVNAYGVFSRYAKLMLLHRNMK